MIEKMLILMFCHLIGDYVLQSDFLATTKGINWWHLLVHSTLYIFPFYIAFGLCWQLAIVWLMHIIIDAGKARYKAISYPADQMLHLALAALYFIV